MLELENDVYIGVEVYETYCTAYYCDGQNQKIMPMDVTGGFGQVEIPLAIKYLEDEKDILIGEVAQLNHDNGDGIYCENFSREDIDLFRDFEKVLFEQVKHINPYGRIVRSCMINLHQNEGIQYMQQDLWLKEQARQNRIIGIDYGYDDLRLLMIENKEQFIINEVKKVTAIGYGYILKAGEKLLSETYKSHIKRQVLLENEVTVCENMAHKILPLALQKMLSAQPLTVTYPIGQEPIRIKISYDVLCHYFDSFRTAFSQLIEEVKNELGDIKIWLIGPGLKLPWSKGLCQGMLLKRDRDERHYYAKLATRLARDGYESLEPQRTMAVSEDIDNEKLFIFEKGSYEITVYGFEGHKRQRLHQEIFEIEADISRIGIALKEKGQQKKASSELEIIRTNYAL